jgi:hypothetical protein
MSPLQLPQRLVDRGDPFFPPTIKKRIDLRPETGEEQPFYRPTRPVERYAQRPHLRRRAGEAVHQQGRCHAALQAEGPVVGTLKDTRERRWIHF